MNRGKGNSKSREKRTGLGKERGNLETARTRSIRTAARNTGKLQLVRLSRQRPRRRKKDALGSSLRDEAGFISEADLYEVFYYIIRAWSRPSMLGGRFVPQMCYPISSGQLTQALKESGSIFDEIAELPVTFCPLNLNNNHWVLLVFDFRSRFGWIWFVDPRGNPAPTWLKKALQRRFSNHFVRNLGGKVQFDGCHCGIWCALIATQYLRCCQDTGFEPAQFTLGRKVAVGVTVDARFKVEQEYNSQVALDTRRFYASQIR